MLHVPWSVLQLDTIKTLVHEFGLAQFTSRTARKNDLIKLLQSIEREGHGEVLRRLQAERDDERNYDYVEDHQREESPELEYSGPAPSTSSASVFASISAPVRPVVEIPVHVHRDARGPLPSPRSTSTSSPAPRFPRTRAKGKAPVRPSPSELLSSSSSPPPAPSVPNLSRVGPPKNKKRKASPPANTSASASASARAGPSSRKRARREQPAPPKLPHVDLSNIPLPSYSILYHQRQSIKEPRREPWPRLNPHETFAGVEIVPRKMRKRPSAAEEVDADADGEQEDAGRERREDGASRPMVIEDAYSVDGSERLGGTGWGMALGNRGTSTGMGTGTAASTTASVTRRMEVVVVTSPKAWKAKSASGRRKTIIVSDEETDIEV